MFSKEDYISEVISLVKSKTAKREIKKELEAHIDDRIEYYIQAGYEKDYATEKAVEKMGNPGDLAISMEKLHNNTLWIALSIIFTVLYILGLIFADIKAVYFGIINMVDFEEVSKFSSVVSVLVFLAGAVAFYTAKKSKSSLLLTMFGVISLATPVLSGYALIPFGYQLVSIVTDFPAAIITSERFFDAGEVFWHIDDLFPMGSPTALFYALVIICVLISLLCVVMGIISIVYAREITRDRQSQGFEDRVNKFASFLIIISVVALVGTCAELTYDFVFTSRENQGYENRFGGNYSEAMEEYDALIIPQTTEEVKALAEEKGLDEYDISEMEYGMLTVYENEAYFVQIRDDDSDGIYETKRYFTHSTPELDKEQIDKLKALKKGSDINELFEIVDRSSIDDYWESVDGNNTTVSITISFDKKNDITYYFNCDYENGVLVKSYDEEV
ncbi:MAG: permease prefix domain 1-containing protein [Eubacterium sp.]